MNTSEIMEFPERAVTPDAPRYEPLRHIASQIWQLNYATLMDLARDLHSDSNVLGENPHAIADLLSIWAKRVIDGQQ